MSAGAAVPRLCGALNRLSSSNPDTGRWGSSIPSWVPVDQSGNAAPLVVDAQNNRGWYSGNAYATEAEFLAATGVSGVLASGIRTFGPYGVPGAPNDFPGTPNLSTLTGLTAVGGSIANVGSELEVTVSAATQGFRFNMPLGRKAYR